MNQFLDNVEILRGQRSNGVSGSRTRVSDNGVNYCGMNPDYCGTGFVIYHHINMEKQSDTMKIEDMSERLYSPLER